MKRLYLHIGTHKTGSTSIQKTCLENKDELLAQGFHYPTSIANSDGNHSALAWFFMGDSRADNIDIEAFKYEINNIGAGNLIISGEEFEFMGVEDLNQVMEFFNDYNITIICYLRPQHELIRSEYIEWLKQGLTSDQFSVFWRLQSNLPRFNYELLYNNWKEKFSNLEFRSFDQAKKLQLGVVEDFFNILNVSSSNIRFCSNQNESPNSKVVKAWLLLARLHELSGGKDYSIADYLYNVSRRNERKPLYELLMRVAEIQPLKQHSSKFIGYHPYEAKQCYSRFTLSNEQLFKSLGSNLWSKEDLQFASEEPVALSIEELSSAYEVFREYYKG
ncbi:hypothetical protein W04_1103 [Pseudoalteromonas sp. SW0106-04]|uniref:hypothetical protein n=1 Tax=Pseudoalteromonas sp. SW0106-04 TaxID=1702169 RepID=UPI0006B5C604|nr:hypothetical protein [Pseudoalteromonas sp. SW0106-04]GAP74587.1 hypothetical protein W04_1103 [Pseudoalteromonas sp. SW0106-04]